MGYSLTVVQPSANGRDGHYISIPTARRIRPAMEEIGMAYAIPEPDHNDMVTTEMDLDGYNPREYYIGHSYAATPTIPLYKLSSNDPWWITVPEITATISAYDYYPWYNPRISVEAMATVHTVQWHEWISFLRYAVLCKGFTVN